jgi:hypothetical protein
MNYDEGGLHHSDDFSMIRAISQLGGQGKGKIAEA